MQKFILLLTLALCTTTAALTQNVGIGTTTPDNTALLEIQSNSKGLLMPRMTAVQKNAIVTPAQGLVVYQTDSVAGFYVYKPNGWRAIFSGILAPSNTITQIFNYTGAVQTYTVPSGISFITVTLNGAAGGQGIYNNTGNSVYATINGGAGGNATGVLAVTPGDIIYIYVGGFPTTITGGFNGGGNGYTGTYGNGPTYATGGAGGGASDIRIGSTSLSSRVIVAGGGGGAGAFYPTQSPECYGGAGGGSSGGAGVCAGAGTGGTQNSGNSIGIGANSATNEKPGGAGGAGYWGGINGLGSSGGNTIFGTGGGGGSGFLGNLVTNGNFGASANTGNGSITITSSQTAISFDYPLNINNIDIANTVRTGLLSSSDWNSFNNKFSAAGLTAGSVLFSNGTTITQNNSSLFWDNTNSRLGIGTSTPNNKLEVIGAGGIKVSSHPSINWIAGNFGDTATGTNRVVIGYLTGASTIGAHNSILNAWANLAINPGGGNVGIGTSTPTNKLEVVGITKTDSLYVTGKTGIGTATPVSQLANTSINTLGSNGLGSQTNSFSWAANAPNGYAGLIYNNDNTSGQGLAVKINATLGTQRLLDLSVGTQNISGNTIMVVKADGTVGILTGAPTSNLSVNGSADKPNGGSWGTFSDARVKQNVQDYTLGLKEILAIRPVSFQYNGKGVYKADGATYVGILAQEIEKVLPGTVTKIAAGGFTDLRKYDGSELTYTLINAIKEQQKIMEDKQKQLDDKQKQIDALIKRLEVLEKK